MQAPYISEQKRKRKKVRRYIFAALGAFALYFIFFGAAWFFMHAPLFRVDSVKVTGDDGQSLTDAAVIAAVEAAPSGTRGFLDSLFGWKNMLAWPDGFAVQNLQLIPQVATATISKDYFSHTVTIAVTERNPVGIWCFIGGGGQYQAQAQSSSSATSSFGGTPSGDEQCYWFDDHGILFARSLPTQGDLIVVVEDYSQNNRGLGSTVLPQEFNANFLSIMNVLHGAGLGVRSVALKDLSLQEVDVATGEGPHIYFSLRFPADDYLPVLRSIITQGGFDKLQYVDCRTEDRIFYK